ncbi:hypothetical protein WS75_03210 [Burkholderia sp. FL-7-2-10-S1-D7]|nr:hypothetical protein WS75_03210 [Burkholderia sp. FL-7-2-10-S1-D7]
MAEAHNLDPDPVVQLTEPRLQRLDLEAIEYPPATFSTLPNPPAFDGMIPIGCGGTRCVRLLIEMPPT